MKAWPAPERRPLPPTRELWVVVRLPRPGMSADVAARFRSIVLGTIRRSTPTDAPLGVLLMASGAVE